MEWFPIESAPADGVFLVHEDGAIRTMFRYKGEWKSLAYAALEDEWGGHIVGEDAKRIAGGRLLKVLDVIHTPTHWMPLPEPPQT